MLIFNESLDAASVDGYTGSFFPWTGCHGGGMSTATHDQCAGSDVTTTTRNNRWGSLCAINIRHSEEVLLFTLIQVRMNLKLILFDHNG